jgi:hypothetical protein
LEVFAMINKLWYLLGVLIWATGLLLTPYGVEAAPGNTSEDSEQQVEILTFTGPAGEQVAVFCISNEAVFGARFDDAGEVRFPGVPGGPSCDETASVLPGHELIMYTSPDEGWTINIWTNEVEICVEGELATVWADNGRPGISYSEAEVCAMAWTNAP